MPVIYLRTFILVLLATLLPIRGAVAAAMLCPGTTQSGHPATAMAHDHHDMNPSHGVELRGEPTDVPAHVPAHDHSQAHGPDDTSAAGHADACQFCAGGCCCVTPLAFAPPSVKSPPLTSSAAFPPLTARFNAHYPDGQDRPPRTS